MMTRKFQRRYFKKQGNFSRNEKRRRLQSVGMGEFNLIKFDGKPVEKLIDVISNGIGVLVLCK